MIQQNKKHFKNLVAVFGIFWFVISCAFLNWTAPPKDREKNLNQVIKDLSFFPINGFHFRLSDLKDMKAIVVFMREKDCPLSEKYGPRIVRLEKQYAHKGIHFIYNYVGQIKAKKSAQEDLNKFGFKGPYVIDSKQTVINTLNAKTTGEVFILTPERRIIYRGPVDDQYHLLKSALVPKNHYVSDILKSITLGKNIIQKKFPAPGCIISRPIIKDQVFWSDVAPIIQKKCTSCHNPSDSAPIDYIKYDDVASRWAMFKYVIKNELMPPWSLDPNTGPWENDLSLTSKEKAILLKWINSGMPKKPGKTELLWSVKKPTASSDYIVHLPEKVVIPAEGLNFYKRFIVQTNFKKDKWIKDVKFIFKPKLVHHMFFFIMDPAFNEPISSNLGTHARRYSLALGSPMGLNDKEEIGYKLPRKAKLLVEIHYEPVGKKIKDDYTHIQINFHKKKPMYKSVVYVIYNTQINIPPYEANYQLRTSYRIKEKMSLIKVASHMHLRGKASSISIIDSKGIRKRIFGIDPFLPALENTYLLKEPLTVSKSSILECTYWYDNSEQNPINPAPEKYVTHGSFKKDEMAMCFFTWKVPVDSNHIRDVWIKNPKL